jgi:hypothetical protein
MYRAIPFLILLFASAVFGADPSPTAKAGSDSVRQALTLALLDEYKARDTYQAIVDRYGPVRPFGNILAAEERHVAALVRHFKALGLAIPEADNTLRPVPASLNEACRAAVQAEQGNVALYTRLLPMVGGHPQIENTFRNLQAASRDRHLPAFERCASRRGKGPRQGSGAGGQGPGKTVP